MSVYGNQCLVGVDPVFEQKLDPPVQASQNNDTLFSFLTYDLLMVDRDGILG